MSWNAGVRSARKQKDGVRGRAQKRTVIAPWIEIAHIEVPVIVSENQEVRLGQAAAALVESRQQCAIRGQRCEAQARAAKTARVTR